MFMDIDIKDLSAMTQKRVRGMREKFFQDTGEARTNKQIIERAVLEFHDKYSRVTIITSAKKAKEGR